jgi:alkylated DNA repair dioxygenase AlkB
VQLVLPIALPPGLVYRPELVSPDQEADLLARIRALPFEQVKMRGMVARRRTAHFGWSYRYDAATVSPGAPVPDFLLDLRRRAAALARLPAGDFEEVLVSEYQPGAGIGWHRDAPPFDVVAGVSLGAACRLRMRPGDAGRATLDLELAPRSAYVLSGPAREVWQHHIPAVKAARYSVTFRTLRRS